MVTAVRVPRPAFVPVRGEDSLEAAGIVGPWEEVLVMVVAFSDINAVYAPRLVFPLTPNISRCCLLLATAVATA